MNLLKYFFKIGMVLQNYNKSHDNGCACNYLKK
jgi:hypothetical protein